MERYGFGRVRAGPVEKQSVNTSVRSIDSRVPRPTVASVSVNLHECGATTIADGARRRAGAVGLSIWTAIVIAAVVWPQVSPLDPLGGVSAAPFLGSWKWSGRLWSLVAAGAGVALVFVVPRLASAIERRWVPAFAGLVGTGWAVVLAASTDGLHRLASPLSSKREYLPFARHIDPARFLDTFVQRAGGYPTHVKGHPPGMVLLLWLLDRIGLAGPGWAAVLVLAIWGLGVASVVWTVGRLGGESAERRTAPFVALTPAVVWAATSGDALIAGVTALAIAVTIAAITSSARDRWLVAAQAFGGGVLFGAALFLSYGVAPLILAPVAVAVVGRCWRPLVWATAGIATAVVAFAAAGFWWFDGLAATRRFYLAGLSRHRSYAYFVLAGNLGALALAIGPAAGAGLGRMIAGARRHPEVVVIAAVIVAVLFADVSGMSKAEVERIWLPYTIWIAAAGGAVSTRHVRSWLGVQVALALGLQLWLVTPW